MSDRVSSRAAVAASGGQRPSVSATGPVAAPADVLGVAQRVARVIRQVIGAPDYDAYVAHVRTHHPERAPLGEREFLQQRLTARYSRPGSRCC